MVTREERLAEFEVTKLPEGDTRVRLLCEDHNGTYLLPFPCRLVAGEWHNAEINKLVEVPVVGWQYWTDLGANH